MVFSPSTDEQVKIHQLKTNLQEHLNASVSTNLKVRQELKKLAANPEFLYKYLRGRKFNVDRAFETILEYAEIKCVLYPEYFPDQVPDYVRPTIEARLMRMLSEKDELGRTYILIDTTNYDDSILSDEEGANVLRYIVEYLMNSTDFLESGLVLLDNMKGLQMKHGKHASTEVNFNFTFWRAFPVKLKAIIYFNVSMLGKTLFSMMKPFIKTKIIDRIYVASGISEVHKRVPLDILPKSLGGKLDDDVAFVPTQQLVDMVLGK